MVKNDQNEVRVPVGIRMLIRRCCQAGTGGRTFHTDAEVSVSFVQQRGDKTPEPDLSSERCTTDVLSFPLGQDGHYDVNKETGCAMLGDVVISLETAVKQAHIYGHSLEREIGFLDRTLHASPVGLMTMKLVRSKSVRCVKKKRQVLGELGISREATFVQSEDGSI